MMEIQPEAKSIYLIDLDTSAQYDRKRKTARGTYCIYWTDRNDKRHMRLESKMFRLTKAELIFYENNRLAYQYTEFEPSI